MGIDAWLSLHAGCCTPMHLHNDAVPSFFSQQNARQQFGRVTALRRRLAFEGIYTHLKTDLVYLSLRGCSRGLRGRFQAPLRISARRFESCTPHFIPCRPVVQDFRLSRGRPGFESWRGNQTYCLFFCCCFSLRVQGNARRICPRLLQRICPTVTVTPRPRDRPSHGHPRPCTSSTSTTC